MSSLGDFLAESERAFAAAGFPSPSHEVEYLVGGRLDLKPAELRLRTSDSLPPDLARTLHVDVQRRLTHEPADHILGWKEFSGRRFAVDRRVLIPRPETELLADLACALVRRVRDPHLLDVGTGSGCLAVTVAREAPGTHVTAVDLSEDALSVARGNAVRLGAESVRFFRSDLFDGLPPEMRGNFDIIVSNPPYVPATTIDRLEPELSYEPGMALNGGPDGLSVIRRLAAEAPAFLKKGGALLLEIGFDQGAAAAEIFRRNGFASVEIRKDLEGNDRIATGVMIGSV